MGIKIGANIHCNAINRREMLLTAQTLGWESVNLTPLFGCIGCIALNGIANSSERKIMSQT